MFIFIISTSSWHGIISISSSLCARNDKTNSFFFFRTRFERRIVEQELLRDVEDAALFSTPRK